MRKIALRGVFLALACFCFVTCRNDYQAPSNTSLTLHVASNFETSVREHWVIVHDQEGRVVDYKSFDNGDVIKLQSAGSKAPVSVTFLSYDPRNVPFHSLETYTGVTPGKDWFLNNIPADEFNYQYQGKFKVTLPDYQQHPYCNITGVEGAGDYPVDMDPQGVFYLNANIYAGISSYLLSRGDASGNYRYKMIDNPSDLQTLSIPFEDMSEFDKVVRFTSPITANVTLGVRAVDNNHDYREWTGFGLNGSQILNMPPGSMKGLYLNMFKHHTTRYTVEISRFQYSYVKQGGPPEHDITMPTFDEPQLTNSSYANFNASTTIPIVTRVSQWSYILPSTITYIGGGTNWKVYGETGMQNLTDFPPALVQKYPDLGLNKLYYDYTTYYTKSLSYSDFIDKIAAGNVPNFGDETFSLKIAAQ